MIIYSPAVSRIAAAARDEHLPKPAEAIDGLLAPAPISFEKRTSRAVLVGTARAGRIRTEQPVLMQQFRQAVV